MKALKYKDRYEKDCMDRKIMQFRSNEVINQYIDRACREEGKDPNLFKSVPYPYDA